MIIITSTNILETCSQNFLSLASLQFESWQDLWEYRATKFQWSGHQSYKPIKKVIRPTSPYFVARLFYRFAGIT